MEEIKQENGFVKFNIISDNGGNAVEIHQIFINEDSREKGLATKFLDLVLEFAEKNGIKKVVTFSSTDPTRETFGKFLVASGFVKTNEANGTGDKWLLEIKDEPKLIKKAVKKAVKKIKGKK